MSSASRNASRAKAFAPLRPPQPEVGERKAEGIADGVGVIDVPRPLQTLVAGAGRLIGEPQVPEVPGLVVPRRCARIVAEPIGEIPVSDRIVGIERLPHERERLAEAAGMKPFERDHAQPDDARPGLPLPLGKRGEPLSEVPQLGAANIQ